MKNAIAITTLLLLVLLLPVAQGQSAHAFLWAAAGGMLDLGTLGGNFSQAQGINASGAVVGYSSLADNMTYHAFLWTAGGGMQDLGAPAGESSFATGINDRGQIVGYSRSAPVNPVFHALLWTSGVMKNLGTLGGKSSYTNGINDSGVVVGSAMIANGHFHPYRWTAAGGMKDLGTIGTVDRGGAAFGINGAGEIVGISDIFNHTEEPYSWTSTGGMKDLLPHHIYIDGSASAINRLGNIAGWVNTNTNSYPAIWTSGGLKVLSTLGGPNAIAIAINGKNQMVGYSGTTSGANHAFFWDQTAGMMDLGTLGGTNSEAFGINSAGQVVGYSELP